MRLLVQGGIFVLIAIIAVIQVVLLFKYTSISRTLSKMRNRSSGDHERYKNGKKNKIHV